MGAVAMAVLAIMAGCNGAPPSGGHGDLDYLFPKLSKVTGHIDGVAADPENPRYFRILRITDDQGGHWEFQSEGWVGVSVGHLKDHQIQGTPVTVAYEQRPGGVLMARGVAD